MKVSLPNMTYDYTRPFNVFERVGEFVDAITSGGVQLSDRNGAIDTIIDANNTYVNTAANLKCNAMFQVCLTDFDKAPDALPRQAYITERALSLGDPIPSESIMYTVNTDVIPAVNSHDTKRYLTSIGYTFSPNYYGFWFKDDAEFLEFKAFVSNEFAGINASHPLDAISRKKLQTFEKRVTADNMVDVLLLDPELTPHSFDAVLPRLFQEYVNQHPQTSGGLPFELASVIHPSRIGIINIQKIGYSQTQNIISAFRKANQFAAGWNDVKTVSKNDLLTLKQQEESNTAFLRYTTTAQYSDKSSLSYRNTTRKFNASYALPNIEKGIMREIKRLGKVNESMNCVRYIQNTYQKSNRRNPLNGDLPGKSQHVNYYPDIHIYLDTSGSISEDMYEGAIRLCIRIAQKLNVDLYFNSFSSYVSPCSKLHTKNRTAKAVYREFQKIDKVSGGTDFMNVWKYIMKSKKRRNEFSMMITDFCDTVPNTGFAYPKRMFYAPVITSDPDEMTWIAEEAQSLADALAPIDRMIYHKIFIPSVVNKE